MEPAGSNLFPSQVPSVTPLSECSSPNFAYFISSPPLTSFFFFDSHCNSTFHLSSASKHQLKLSQQLQLPSSTTTTIMSSSPPPAEGPQPKKRKANPNATPKATSKATPKTTPKATPKKKAPKTNNGKTIPIATSLEHAHEAELEMIEMRKKGIKWAEVAVMWEEKTGMKSTTKVLSGRFCRMMDNLQVWPAEHVRSHRPSFP
jgi:hypothetical protein